MTGVYDSPERKAIRKQIASATPKGQCEACAGMFEGTDAVCWLIVAAEGVMGELDDSAGERMMGRCVNSDIVALVRKYRGPRVV